MTPRRAGRAVLAVLAFVAATLTTSATAATAGPAAAAAPCAGWTVTTVADGLGALENLHPDGRGGVYLSVLDQNAVRHVSADGTVTTLAADVEAPGGLRLAGPYLYVLTGNTPASLLFATPTGGLLRIDTRDGSRRVVASGLVAPNGLVALPDGTFLASRIGFGLRPTGITRIDPASGAVQPNWAPVQQGNGMVLARDGRSVYVDQFLTGEVLRVPLSRPSAPSRAAELPGLLPGPDDLDIDRAGILYVAASVEGRVLRVDPSSGASCAVATGFGIPTAVKVVDREGARVLAVTSFDGALRVVRPPAGVAL